MTEDDLSLRAHDETDVEEAVREIRMPRLGLRHDVHTELACPLPDLVGFRARNVDGAVARVLDVIEVLGLVRKALQSALRNGDEPHGQVHAAEQNAEAAEVMKMLQVLRDLAPVVNAPDRRDQAD